MFFCKFATLDVSRYIAMQYYIYSNRASKCRKVPKNIPVLFLSAADFF